MAKRLKPLALAAASLCVLGISTGGWAVSGGLSELSDREGVTLDPRVPYVSGVPIAYMVDLASGQTLYAKNADKPVPPASMAKMMTTHLAFRLIQQGKLRLDTKFVVRDDTWRKWHGPSAGSTMFLLPGETITVENLLHGIVTLSGNDACVVLAEGIAGSEAAFVAMMNDEARRLGLKGSRFGTSNGWPDGGRTMVTARDLATLAISTIEETPDLYRKFYGTRSFTWGKTMGGGAITQPNRNPILGKIGGADGLKTGHTAEAGYGFTGSAQQGNRRIVMVVAGAESFDRRATESVRFMDWGFKSWETRPLVRKGAAVGEAEVQIGRARRVPLIAPRDLQAIGPRGQLAIKSVSIRYLGPVTPPIRKGQKLADLVVVSVGGGEQRLPLVAGDDVGLANGPRRVWNGLMRVFGG